MKNRLYNIGFITVFLSFLISGIQDGYFSDIGLLCLKRVYCLWDSTFVCAFCRNYILISREGESYGFT